MLMYQIYKFLLMPPVSTSASGCPATTGKPKVTFDMSHRSSCFITSSVTGYFAAVPPLVTSIMAPETVCSPQ